MTHLRAVSAECRSRPLQSQFLRNRDHTRVPLEPGAGATWHPACSRCTGTQMICRYSTVPLLHSSPCQIIVSQVLPSRRSKPIAEDKLAWAYHLGSARQSSEDVEDRQPCRHAEMMTCRSFRSCPLRLGALLSCVQTSRTKASCTNSPPHSWMCSRTKSTSSVADNRPKASTTH